MAQRLAMVQRPKWVLWNSVHLLLVLLGARSCQSLVARCPPADFFDSPESYCECSQTMSRSGRTVRIVCDFRNSEDVLLTDALYPFRESNLVSVYVRLVNATSLQVTGAFLQEWLDAPSAALDVWRSGTVTLAPTPQLTSNRALFSYTTYVGIGISGCYVPEIPSKLLRDRMAGSLRITNSVVGVMKKGFIHNIKEMRYLVLENSEVEAIEGSVTTVGYITFSSRQVHKWNGLILSNVTIHNLASGAFNLTRQQGRLKKTSYKAEVRGCHLGKVATGAITATGDVAVTIKDNTFQRLEKEAFKVDVRKELKFEGNVAVSLDTHALEGLVCQNFTSLEKNTVHLNTISPGPNNKSIIPFHVTCGNPQVFMVVSPSQPRSVVMTSTATWVLLTILLLLLLAIVLGIVLHWRSQNHQRRKYREGNTFHFFNRIRSSKENVSSDPELNMTEVPVDGVSNPLYDRTEPSCSIIQDGEGLPNQ